MRWSQCWRRCRMRAGSSARKVQLCIPTAVATITDVLHQQTFLCSRT